MTRADLRQSVLAVSAAIKVFAVAPIRASRFGVLCALGLTGAAQQPSVPRFEVASIKRWERPTTSAPGVYRSVLAPPGSGIFNCSTTLAWLIAEAYGVQDFQLSGGEDWVRTERYDVAARAGRDVSEPELARWSRRFLRTDSSCV